MTFRGTFDLLSAVQIVLAHSPLEPSFDGDVCHPRMKIAKFLWFCGLGKANAIEFSYQS
jgi:hypothetical protein